MIEAQSLGRVVRPVNAITILQARPCLGQVAMPNLIGLLPDVDPLQLAAPRLIEKTEFNFFRVFREKGKIHSFAVPGRPQRVGFAWPDDDLVLNFRPSVGLRRDFRNFY